MLLLQAMNYNALELLMYLAEKSRLFTPLETSTTRIASDLGLSQQTISRKLREMEKEEFIARKVGYRGHVITLTHKSISMLREHSRRIQAILKNKKGVVVGTIEEGAGEGRYYLSLRQYREKIKRKVGFAPYAGTLNVKVSKESISPFLNSLIPIKIGGFKTSKRTFGEVTCYKIRFRNIDAAILLPERTMYENVLEIIAPFNLRKRFNLKTGDKITINQ
jgi:riboflavin kinase